MRFTVFTPAYNRGYIIENLYKSLCVQTFRDFEWVVVDDGSTDNTSELFENFLKNNNNFPIKYRKVENGGKHKAINIGLEMAEGELFFIVDSDDYLTENSLEIVDRVEKTIPTDKKDSFIGVGGLRGYSLDRIIGDTYEGEFLDITNLERPKYNVQGDKAEVFYTKIFREKYKFPEFEGEKFLTECVVWDRMAFDGYKIRFFNEIIYICDYLPDGLTKNLNKILDSSPKGHGLSIAQDIRFGKIAGYDKWDSYLRYYYKFRGKLTFREIAKNLDVNVIRLFFRINGMKLYGWLYSK